MKLHPDVVEMGVVAMPDERLGERVCAFVVLPPGADLELSDVAELFRATGVVRHKRPERLAIVDDLPRGPRGKVLKAQLRASIGT